MEEVHTNLAEVSADFVSLWSAEQQRHTDIRELFVSSEAVTRAERVQVQVGEETDELLVYEAPSNDQVPALADILQFIEQRLGAGTVVNKYYTVNRKNISLLQPETITTRRGRTGARGARGAAGKAAVTVQEGDNYLRTRQGPRGRRGARALHVESSEIQPRRGSLGREWPPASRAHRATQEHLALLAPRARREMTVRPGHRVRLERLALLVHRASMATPAKGGCLVHRVCLALPASRVHRARPGQRAREETSDLMDPAALKVSRARSARKVHRESWGQLALRVHRASRVYEGRLASRERGARGGSQAPWCCRRGTRFSRGR
jgi:hypothetical protein